MTSGIRARIRALSRVTMIGALLVAALVIVASRLPVDKTPAAQAPASLVHLDNRPAADATRRAGPSSGPPAGSPMQSTVDVLPSPTWVALSTSEPPPDVSRRIGILAGHWGYDSGAICDDGLREVDITTDIARRVADRLRTVGYEVDILQEHDPDKPKPPLQNYLAAAFLSLHVDSCLPGASGFKVSRWAFSRMPKVEDRLVNCMYDEYGAVTGLSHHDDSITIDMWNYYAFREIGEPTPGAIIEMGFMTGDRWLLINQPDQAAEGIVNGLRCFLEGATEQP